jgi:hypothetical protein
LPGLGVDSWSCEPRRPPCPGSMSPSHLLKGVISVQRDLPRQWAEGDLVGNKRHLFGEQSWYLGKPGFQKLDPTCFYPVCCGSQRGRFVGTGVGPLGQQAPQLPSLNTVKTIIDFFFYAFCLERASLRWYRVCLQCRRPRFDHWVGKIPWRKKRQHTPVFLFAEFH